VKQGDFKQPVSLFKLPPPELRSAIQSFAIAHCKVERLVSDIQMHDVLLGDLRRFNSARRDPDGTEIQAFVADCLDQVRTKKYCFHCVLAEKERILNNVVRTQQQEIHERTWVVGMLVRVFFTDFFLKQS